MDSIFKKKNHCLFVFDVFVVCLCAAQTLICLEMFCFPFQQLKDIRQKEKVQMNRLPALPLPTIDQDLTRVIPCYQHSNLKGAHPERTVVNSTLETKDNFFNQTFGKNDEIAKNNNWTSVGNASFEDKFDPKLAQRWIQLEGEAYESINITPLPPLFRPHIPCLSSKTDNSTRPLCVVRGMLYHLCLT